MRPKLCPKLLHPPCPSSFGRVITDHSDGTKCASCCGAFRKSWFPSLFSIVSQCRRFVVEHFGIGGLGKWDELILPVCLLVGKSV